MSETVLSIKGLTKKYGRVKALSDLNLDIKRGQVFGLLGPNGSGKTTTLGTVLGAINATSGSFSWFGEGQGHHLRKRIGAILESPSFYHYMSAADNLRVVAEIKGAPRERIDAVLERVGLGNRKNDAFKTYSLGMKQRLAIGSAVYQGSVAELLNANTRVEIDAEDRAALKSAVSGIDFVTSLKEAPAHMTAILTEGRDASELNAALIAKGITLSHLNRRHESLEQRFLEILKTEGQ
ncbi:MAG: ATP-binding cassette domain-containing protein [Flavobacteriales bacterium]|nr:ATP-binding cassette domain-containing protein [Flavobacteriales bacterium]